VDTLMEEKTHHLSVQESKQRIHLANLIVEINRKLQSGINYLSILDFIFDSLYHLIPFDRIGIALAESVEGQNRLVSKWAKSKSPIVGIKIGYSAPVQGSSLQKVFDSRQPRIINDLAAYFAAHPGSESTKLILQDGMRSNLTCPLISQNQPIGVIFFSSKVQNTYSKQHIDSFLEIADEISVIIENGQLRREFDAYMRQTKNLGMILHDLKSPLSTIQSFAEFSVDEPWFQELGNKGKEVFKVFLRNSKIMFELLNQLLEITQLDQKADSPKITDVLLKPFLEEIETLGRNLSTPKKIEFINETTSIVPFTAKFDFSQIRRVLENLLSNAVKYSFRGSRIFFAVKMIEGQLHFFIRDEGLGIPESEHAKLFQDFGKTSVRPTENESSTGLGLAISKRIVENHHGKIQVFSKVGFGSTFSFCIPLSIHS
jgi:signal transduction histidine kinase